MTEFETDADRARNQCDRAAQAIAAAAREDWDTAVAAAVETEVEARGKIVEITAAVGTAREGMVATAAAAEEACAALTAAAREAKAEVAQSSASAASEISESVEAHAVGVARQCGAVTCQVRALCPPLTSCGKSFPPHSPPPHPHRIPTFSQRRSSTRHRS